jgi:hypothetical protein
VAAEDGRRQAAARRPRGGGDAAALKVVEKVVTMSDGLLPRGTGRWLDRRQSYSDQSRLSTAPTVLEGAGATEPDQEPVAHAVDEAVVPITTLRGEYDRRKGLVRLPDRRAGDALLNDGTSKE